MWQFIRKLCTRFFGVWTQHRSEPRPTFGGTVDWLPPVLGPGEWSLGLMSDLNVAWYFDRFRS